jgi:hypothetical protein
VLPGYVDTITSGRSAAIAACSPRADSTTARRPARRRVGPKAGDQPILSVEHPGGAFEDRLRPVAHNDARAAPRDLDRVQDGDMRLRLALADRVGEQLGRRSCPAPISALRIRTRVIP